MHYGPCLIRPLNQACLSPELPSHEFLVALLPLDDLRFLAGARSFLGTSPRRGVSIPGLFPGSLALAGKGVPLGGVKISCRAGQPAAGFLAPAVGRNVL
jgi:hypothetical protein